MVSIYQVLQYYESFMYLFVILMVAIKHRLISRNQVNNSPQLYILYAGYTISGIRMMTELVYLLTQTKLQYYPYFHSIQIPFYDYCTMLTFDLLNDYKMSQYCKVHWPKVVSTGIELAALAAFSLGCACFLSLYNHMYILSSLNALSTFSFFNNIYIVIFQIYKFIQVSVQQKNDKDLYKVFYNHQLSPQIKEYAQTQIVDQTNLYFKLSQSMILGICIHIAFQIGTLLFIYSYGFIGSQFYIIHSFGRGIQTLAWIFEIWVQ